MGDLSLIEGLKQALEKKESLRSAMASFVNAGYDPKEVESAARIVHSAQAQRPVAMNTESPKPVQNYQKNFVLPTGKSHTLIQNNSDQKNQNLQKNNFQQEVSNYEGKSKKTKIIILIAMMIILLMALVGVFMFRTELMRFINNLF